MPKKHEIIAILPIALPLLIVLAAVIYLSITQGILFSLVVLAPIATALIFTGIYYAYNGIKNFLDKRKQAKMDKIESDVISEPNRPFVHKGSKDKPEYHYHVKPEPIAAPKNYKPSDTPDLHKKLPTALLQSITQNLTAREVALLKQSDKTLEHDLDFTKHPAIEFHLNDLGTPGQKPAEKLELFKAACKEVKETYPQDLIDICGIHVLAGLPILTLRDDQPELNYIDDVSLEQLKGHKAMRGIDKTKRPFVSLCLKLNGQKAPFVLTLFQRYTNDETNWQVGGYYGYKIRADTPSALFKILDAIFQGTHPELSLVESQGDPKPKISRGGS